jgi:nucleotide-binding universal stress UspA family protein
LTKNAIMIDADSNCSIQRRRILIPVDGSKCSLKADRYAVKLTKDENAQLFGIHVIGEYHMDMKEILRT